MKASDITVGFKWVPKPEIINGVAYGRYTFKEITSIKVTKAGRLKFFLRYEYKSVDGQVIRRENIEMLNGACAPNTQVIPDLD